MRHRFALPRFLAATVAAGIATAGLLAPPSFAATGPKSPTSAPASTATAPATAPQASAPLGANTGPSTQADVRGQRLDPAKQPPVSPATASKPAVPPKPAAHSKPAALAAAQSCTAVDFGSRSGSALAAYVQSSTMDCVNSLFTLTGSDAHSVFDEAQMVTVANAFKSASAAYPGDNSTNVWQLELFLRAGYYVQFYHPTDVGTYGPTLATAIEGALDAFVASPHFMDVSAANGGVVGDAIVLTDSANEQARYLSTYKQVLNAYNSSYDAYASMDAAVNDVFTPIFRGHQNPAFITAVTADPSIIDTLNAFALNHQSALSGSSSYLDSNAGTETARFLDTAALQAKVRPLVKGLLGASAITGTSAPLWVGVGGMTASYDQAQCSYYGTCNFAAQLSAASLPTTTACGPTITLLTQALTASDLTAVCTSLQSEIPYFQNLDKVTSPIPGQYETHVRLAIFASSRDYQTYSSWIFGNSTNNGGETLSGNITDPTNQPVSIQYQWPADNGFPARVWNLNHEFTHLMQGAYDMKGTFATEITVPDIWWIEGQAEYVSYSYRGVTDTDAVTQASQHTYNLSTLFQSTYDNSDQTRTYPWGYLAVRYMFEKHPADISNMLSHFRTGDYAGGYAVYHSIGTAYDADFNAWLDALANVGANGPSTPCTDPDTRAMGQNCYRTNESATAGNDDSLFVFVPAGTSTLTISTSGGTGNADLYYNPATWASPTAYTAESTNSGTGQSISVTSTNATAGFRYIDLHAATAFSGVTVSTRYVFGSGGGSLPACTATDTRAMGQNCSRANESATAGNSDYFFVYLPAGTSTLTVSAGGGTGNADLYYNPTTWASPTAYTAESTNPGNFQTITVTNTTAGYRYISLYAATDFSGVTVSTQY
ncbi:microbial collagenase [Kitasatospora sp. MAP12-15]|uniref:M9 family metallopeptidase n=1 Tax=unclassified Kitasatospora TaxID=2633591 RepID=UPI002473FFB1|nr:M9 family metallopeptidase [Kitasatospora sp. MAP12-44]MDH6108410.1 microbial collagenase [Kitasatospora sp. MAP12-44]